MHLDGTEVPLRFGTLVVVSRDGIEPDSSGEAAAVDWEVVADGLDDYAGELKRHRVELLCITHANEDGQLVLGELSGDAVVVRFVERTVVLRGDGPLSGFSPALFEV